MLLSLSIVCQSFANQTHPLYNIPHYVAIVTSYYNLLYQACQWMTYNRTCTHPHMPVLSYVCYCCTCKTFYDNFKNLSYIFPSVLIPNSLIMYFLQKIRKRYTSVAFTNVWEIASKNRHAAYIFWSSSLEVRESFWTDTQSSF